MCPYHMYKENTIFHNVLFNDNRLQLKILICSYIVLTCLGRARGIARHFVKCIDVGRCVKIK